MGPRALPAGAQLCRPPDTARWALYSSAWAPRTGSGARGPQGQAPTHRCAITKRASRWGPRAPTLSPSGALRGHTAGCVEVSTASRAQSRPPPGTPPRGKHSSGCQRDIGQQRPVRAFHHGTEQMRRPHKGQRNCREGTSATCKGQRRAGEPPGAESDNATNPRRRDPRRSLRGTARLLHSGGRACRRPLPTPGEPPKACRKGFREGLSRVGSRGMH